MAFQVGAFQTNYQQVVGAVTVAIESLGENQRRWWYRGQQLTRDEIERVYRKRAADARKREAARLKALEDLPVAPVQALATDLVFELPPFIDEYTIEKTLDELGARIAKLPNTNDDDIEAVYAFMVACLIDEMDL